MIITLTNEKTDSGLSGMIGSLEFIRHIIMKFNRIHLKYKFLLFITLVETVTGAKTILLKFSNFTYRDLHFLS